jgi:hypothetical protein
MLGHVERAVGVHRDLDVRPRQPELVSQRRKGRADKKEGED